ncbi:MAG: 2-dehydropantoate 2-reductase [Oscillospiraceae bacterium]|nr:2-dehydropantoate 2-reductase [Oscillospiraceae bacterium]
MKIGILGAGAMGSLIGAHLKKGGGEVYFVDVFDEHMKAIRETGLVMELDDCPEIQRVFPDGAFTSGSEAGVCDAVIVLVKCYDTAAAVEANPELFGPDTSVLTLQNGVGAADILEKYFKAERLGTGVIKSNAALLGPGRISGRLSFPHSAGGIDFSPVKPETPYRHVYGELERLWQAGGMPARCGDSTERFIWDKLCLNVMYNGLGALLQLSNEDMSTREDGYLLMNEVARETCEVARAKGIELNINDYLIDRTGKPPFDRSRVKTFHYVSALIDSYRKRKTEIDFLNGAVVREGKKHGVSTPYNDAILRLVRLMQDTYDIRYDPGS